jgi:hypothetical protein
VQVNMESGSPETHKLMDDIRAVPSWVWLGGAAAVGIFVVLRGTLGGGAASTGAAVAPLTGATISPTTDVTGGTSALSQQIDQLAAQIALLTPTTPGGGAATGGTSGSGSATSGGFSPPVGYTLNQITAPGGTLYSAFPNKIPANITSQSQLPPAYYYIPGQTQGWQPIASNGSLSSAYNNFFQANAGNVTLPSAGPLPSYNGPGSYFNGVWLP